MLKYSSELGMVGFDADVFSKIALKTAMSFGNLIMLTNQKGRPVKNPEEVNEKFTFVNVEENKEGDAISIEVFFVVKFGTSISALTKEYASRLREETERITGMSIENVTVNITGVRSKKIARRELKITC